jgi:hypothetical protein
MPVFFMATHHNQSSGNFAKSESGGGGRAVLFGEVYRPGSFGFWGLSKLDLVICALEIDNSHAQALVIDNSKALAQHLHLLVEGAGLSIPTISHKYLIELLGTKHGMLHDNGRESPMHDVKMKADGNENVFEEGEQGPNEGDSKNERDSGNNGSEGEGEDGSKDSGEGEEYEEMSKLEYQSGTCQYVQEMDFDIDSYL